MAPTRINADFNGLVSGPRNPERTAVVLDTFGSLRDLSNAGVVLREDLPLIAVDWSDDHEDLEGHETAQYDREKKRWVVEFDEVGVRYVPAGDRSPVRPLPPPRSSDRTAGAIWPTRAPAGGPGESPRQR